MGRGTRKLAGVLHRKATGKGKGPMNIDAALFGKIVSIQQGTNIDTLTLQVGGAASSLLAGVEHLDSYDPKVGAQVYYHVIHGVPFVLGAMGPFAPYPNFTPYIPPPVVPTVDVTTYIAQANFSGSPQEIVLSAITSAGGLAAQVSTGLFAVQPSNRVSARWAAVSPGQGLLALVGTTSAGGSTQKCQIYQIGAYGYPGLGLLTTITPTSGAGQCSVVWDPSTPIVYVYCVGDGTITGYDPTGAVVAGPVTVSDTLTGTPTPVLSATADGALYMVDSDSNIGVWATGSLSAIGEASTSGATIDFVANGDGSVDVAGGGGPYGISLGPLFNVDAGTPSATEISGSSTLGMPGMAGVANSVLYMLGWYVDSTSNQFTGWNVGAPEALPTFSLLTGAITTVRAMCVAPDGVTGLALGTDDDFNLWLIPFYSSGEVGTPILLPDGPYGMSAAKSTEMFMASPLAHPALPVFTT